MNSTGGSFGASPDIDYKLQNAGHSPVGKSDIDDLWSEDSLFRDERLPAANQFVQAKFSTPCPGSSGQESAASGFRGQGKVRISKVPQGLTPDEFLAQREKAKSNKDGSKKAGCFKRPSSSLMAKRRRMGSLLSEKKPIKKGKTKPDTSFRSTAGVQRPIKKASGPGRVFWCPDRGFLLHLRWKESYNGGKSTFKVEGLVEVSCWTTKNRLLLTSSWIDEKEKEGKGTIEYHLSSENGMKQRAISQIGGTVAIRKDLLQRPPRIWLSLKLC